MNKLDQSYKTVRRLQIGMATLLVSLMTLASADESVEAKRTVLERHDQTGVDGREVVLGTAELPARAVIGWHVHPGDESGYVMKGHVVLKVKGQPERTLNAGDHFFNP